MLSELNQIKTKDGLRLEGLLFKAQGKALRRGSGRAIALWLGGLGSRFSSSPARVHAIAGELAKKKISFAVFNNRGFGDVNSLTIKHGKKSAYKYFGASFEKFEDCVLDIEAMIRFCRKRGYKKIFLLGYSTGANKTAYYILKKRGRGIAAACLLGPMNDAIVIKKELGRKYKKALETAGKMVRRGKGSELLPMTMTNGMFWTAARFWSNARKSSNEDLFPYYDPKRKFRWTKNIRLPVLVLIGSREQHADRPVLEIMERFQREIPAEYFSGKIIKGANHGFRKKEKELGRELAKWISMVSRK